MRVEIDYTVNENDPTPREGHGGSQLLSCELVELRNLDRVNICHG